MVQMGDRQGHTAMVESKLLFYEYQRCHILFSMAPNGDLNNIAGGTFMKKVSLFTAVAMFALAATVAFGISAIPAKTVKADGDVQINEENFPDEVFRDWVKANIGNGDNVLTQEEISQVKSIDVESLEIKDLYGIGFFTNLEDLLCDYTLMTSLDVNRNTALKKLQCGGNSIFKYLEVSNNPALEELVCDESALTYLNLRGCPSLKRLVCSDNMLTELDVSRNRQLNRLRCKDNMINTIWLPKASSEFSTFECDTGVNVIVLEDGDIAISKVNFWDDNFRNWILEQSYGADGVLTKNEIAAVKEIDVNKKEIANLKGIEIFTALERLNCAYNKLTSLDVSKNTALTKLDCFSNQLTSLDVSKNTALT